MTDLPESFSGNWQLFFGRRKADSRRPGGPLVRRRSVRQQQMPRLAGFTLVETLIASLLTTSVFIGSLPLMKLIAANHTRMAMQSSLMDLKNQMVQNFATTARCTQAFSGVQFNPTQAFPAGLNAGIALPGVTLTPQVSSAMQSQPSGGSSAATGVLPFSSGVGIKSLQWILPNSSLVQAPLMTSTPLLNTYLALLKVEVFASGTPSVNSLTGTVPLMVSINPSDPTHQIRSCTTQTDLVGACVNLNGIIDNTGKCTFPLPVVTSGPSGYPCVAASVGVGVFQPGQGIWVCNGSNWEFPYGPCTRTFTDANQHDFQELTGRLSYHFTWDPVQPGLTLAYLQAGDQPAVHTSRVFNSCTQGKSWASFGWVSTLPTSKKMLGLGQSEPTSAYPLASPAVMSQNVGLWHFNDAPGSIIALDSATSSPNNGTVFGNVRFGSPGKIGTAAQIPDSNSFISLGNGGNGSDLDKAMEDEFTIAFWYNGTTIPHTESTIFVRGANTALSPRIYQVQNSSVPGMIYMELWDLSVTQDHPSTAYQQNQSYFYPSTNNWGHIAVVFNRKAMSVIMYSSGVEFQNGNSVNPAQMPSSIPKYLKKQDSRGTPYVIGNTLVSGGPIIFPCFTDSGNSVLGLTNSCNPVGGSTNVTTENTPDKGNMNGYIQEFAVWNRSLSPGEILQLYLRAANQIRFQIRAWDLTDYPHCIAGTEGSCPPFRGPDGTPNTYFSEIYSTTTSSPTFGLNPVTYPGNSTPVGSASFTGQFFQYQVTMHSDNSNVGSGLGQFFPELTSVKVGN